MLAHGFAASADDTKVVAIANALVEGGMDVVTYDARGHGSSGGHCSLGDLECHDVAAAVGLARERSDRVVLVGASMGAIAVLRHAAADARLAGVVVVSCPARWELPRTWRAILAALLTRTRPGRAVAARWLGVRVAPGRFLADPPVLLASRVQSPLAIVHGLADRFIPPAAARELHDAAREPRRLDLVPGMAHAFDPRSVGPVRVAVEWSLDRSSEPVSSP